ncbi:MAG: hypothetical protein ACPGJU_02270 [Coraliomargarita sp.]
MKTVCYLFFVIFSVLLLRLEAVISLDGSTGWSAITYGNNTSDYLDDKQTGQGDADIVGDLNQFGVYKAYDFGSDPNSINDDYIGFRLRMS